MNQNLLKRISLFTLVIALFASCTKDDTINYLNSRLKPPAVVAGNAKNIFIPITYDTLRGNATSFNGPVTGYLWSLISGPSVPTIENPSSRVTRISNMILGTYKFQFAVIDSAGLTGVDTTSITVLPNAHPVITLTLQPTSNATEANFALSGTQNVTAHEGDLCAEAWTSGGDQFLIRGAFKFDLSSIPAGSTILTAKLSLFSNPVPTNGDLTNANSGSNNAFYIQRNTSNWDATNTWFTQPTTQTTDQVLIPHTNSSFLDLTDIDVKNMISTMFLTNNYGFKISLQQENAYNTRQFASSKYTDASKHPKLVLTYQ